MNKFKPQLRLRLEGQRSWTHCPRAEKRLACHPTLQVLEHIAPQTLVIQYFLHKGVKLSNKNAGFKQFINQNFKATELKQIAWSWIYEYWFCNHFLSPFIWSILNVIRTGEGINVQGNIFLDLVGICTMYIVQVRTGVFCLLKMVHTLKIWSEIRIIWLFCHCYFWWRVSKFGISWKKQVY